MNSKTDERIRGIIVLIVGLVLAYTCIISPWIAVTQHQKNIFLSMNGVAITPLTLGLGFAYTVFGKKASLVLGHPQKFSIFGWVFSIVLTIFGLIYYFWFKSVLAGYGYKF